MFLKTERGFTWYELVIVLVILIVVALVTLPNFSKPCQKAVEAEVKANCHTIQICIERYYTDNNEYPPYLLGGDVEGWQDWHTKWDGINNISLPNGRVSSNDIVVDLLIDADYMTSYPRNPFTNEDRNMIIVTSLENSRKEGNGDPRFGYKGYLMGNILDDPFWFCGALQNDPSKFPEIETRRTLDHGDYMNVPKAFQNPTTNPYYLAGGFRDPGNPSSGIVRTWWPGNFFYRARARETYDWNSGTDVFPHVGLTQKAEFYILGGYGKLQTDGADVIRLTPFDENWNRMKWSYPPEYKGGDFYCGYGFNTVSGGFGGLPEVFGGGESSIGPRFPYIDATNSQSPVLYGAPDGVRDGIILVLTSGSENPKFIK